MEIIKKLAKKNAEIYGSRQPVIAFLGDSVTQGCFELYKKSDTALETIFDPENSYPRHLQKMLAEVFPAAPVTIVNAGISGDNATQALGRLDRDVLSYKPDLVVVCFGLNDFSSGKAGLESYKNSMRRIIRAVKDAGAEVIVMTPNTVANHVSVHVENQSEFIKKCVKGTVDLYNEGYLDEYIDGARQVAKEENVPVCDAYKRWKRLEEQGVDTAELLANKVNHPTRKMNELFAEMLFGVMVEN